MKRKLIATIAFLAAACYTPRGTNKTTFEPPMPEKYGDQIVHSVRYGHIVNVVGASREKGPDLKLPWGSDWHLEDNLENLLVKYPDLVLMVEAADCQGCARARPFYERYARENAGRAAFTAAEAHYTQPNFSIPERYKVNDIPLFIVFKNGREIERFGSPKDYTDLKSRLDGFLSKQ